jgi:hypothetical protein
MGMPRRAQGNRMARRRCVSQLPSQEFDRFCIAVRFDDDVPGNRCRIQVAGVVQDDAIGGACGGRNDGATVAAAKEPISNSRRVAANSGLRDRGGLLVISAPISLGAYCSLAPWLHYGRRPHP